MPCESIVSYHSQCEPYLASSRTLAVAMQRLPPAWLLSSWFLSSLVLSASSLLLDVYSLEPSFCAYLWSSGHLLSQRGPETLNRRMGTASSWLRSCGTNFASATSMLPWLLHGSMASKWSHMRPSLMQPQCWATWEILFLSIKWRSIWPWSRVRCSFARSIFDICFNL